MRPVDRSHGDLDGDLAYEVLRSLHEGIIVIDNELVIRYFNPAAEKLTGRSAADRVGQPARFISRERSPILEVFETGTPLYNVDSELQDGRVWHCNYVPVMQNGKIAAVVQSFTDVTQERQLARSLEQARAELDDAFALTLPNTKLERKLRSTPEFVDRYDSETGLATVTAIIPDGTYKHVINALKVLADLYRQGVLTLVGLDKDTLVQAVIFHDLGKSQPNLRVGDVFDPKQAFEPSKAHAQRSAEMAEHMYRRSPDVVELVRHHHHDETELPPAFPKHLLPMLRLLKLVDGLSASLTRRGGVVMVNGRGTEVIWHEQSGHPRYDGFWFLNLYTGEGGRMTEADALSLRWSSRGVQA